MKVEIQRRMKENVEDDHRILTQGKQCVHADLAIGVMTIEEI